jgi:hypothetical protein
MRFPLQVPKLFNELGIFPVLVSVEDQELVKQLLTGIGCSDRRLVLSGFVVKEILRI